MRVLIVGAGAVGGYFGAHLVAAGRDVTFLVRPARARQLAADGLVVRSPDHPNVIVEPATVSAAELTTGWDLVVLAVKAYGLQTALDDVARAIDEQTAVLPLLNGMAHFDVLSGRFGERSVLGGFAYCSTYLESDGAIIAGPMPASVTYGECDGGRTNRIERVDDTLRGAGFLATMSRNINADLWEKWVFLASGGVLNTLTGGSVGESVAAPGGLQTALAILAEATAVATACGFPPRDPALRNAEAVLTESGSSFRTSMGKDLLAGRATENEQIVGDLVDRADRQGVPVPLLRAARVALLVAADRR